MQEEEEPNLDAGPSRLEEFAEQVKEQDEFLPSGRSRGLQVLDDTTDEEAPESLQAQ